MQLSRHFSLEELTHTDTVLDNAPPTNIVSELKRLCEFLEVVRIALGNNPMHIDSGYRSPLVNTAIGGIYNSQHMKGQAADFICPKFGTPLAICNELESSGLYYDQLINEHTWVHISIPAMGVKPRKECLTLRSFGKYEAGIVP